MTQDDRTLVERLAKRMAGEVFPRATLTSDMAKLLMLIRSMDAEIARLQPFEARVKAQRQAVRTKMGKLSELEYREVLYQRKLRRFAVSLKEKNHVV